VLFLLNAFWVVLMLILQTKQTGDLDVIGTNPLDLLFLVLYGGIFAIQFLTLVWHRLGTVVQALSQVDFPLFASEHKRPHASRCSSWPISLIQNEIPADDAAD